MHYGHTHSYRRGFTLVEILIVISILAIIATILLTGFRNFARFQEFNQAASDVQFLLSQTRVAARSATLDSAHGIKIGSNTITTFVGDTYDAMDPDNETHTYQMVTFTPLLAGGVDEIVFAKLSGLPSATGRIMIEGTVFAATTTVEITNTSVIQ